MTDSASRRSRRPPRTSARRPLPAAHNPPSERAPTGAWWWLDAPSAFCSRADRACLHLRDWLTADNAGSITTREAAFALVTRPVTAAIALRPPAESKADDRIAFNQAARVAAAVSRNLKIVADPARELPRDFTALAFPLLEQVAPVGTSGIAHDIVRVLQRFDVRPYAGSRTVSDGRRRPGLTRPMV